MRLYGALLRGTVTRHCYEALLRGAVTRHCYDTLLRDTVTRYCCETLSRGTVARHCCEAPRSSPGAHSCARTAARAVVLEAKISRRRERPNRTQNAQLCARWPSALQSSVVPGLNASPQTHRRARAGPKPAFFGKCPPPQKNKGVGSIDFSRRKIYRAREEFG
jgi:hypothetical protein